MISEFFSKAREKELARKIELQEELDFVVTHIRETEKFLEFLNKEDTAPFTDFSPKVMSQSDISHKEELLKELEIDKQNRFFLEEKIEEIDSFITEMDRVAKRADELVKKEDPKQLSVEKVKEEILKINNYLPQDPIRAKLELESLVNKI